VSITIKFTPWHPFRADKDESVIRRWLKKVGEESEAAFKKGAGRQWGGGAGSSPGEWPMRRSGNLIDTIGHEVSGYSVTVGSGAIRTVRAGAPFDYSNWLRSTGRKMSKEALQEGMNNAGEIGHWVRWIRL
jgi:hypothetical protein